MSRVVLFLLLFVISCFSLTAQISVSGIFDSTVSMQAGAGDSPEFSCGIEEYVNLRMQARIQDKVRIDAAVNFIAAAGNYALTAKQMAELSALDDNTPESFSPSSYINGKNYLAGIELERLYFRLNMTHADFDFGLMRMQFG